MFNFTEYFILTVNILNYFAIRIFIKIFLYSKNVDKATFLSFNLVSIPLFMSVIICQNNKTSVEQN